MLHRRTLLALTLLTACGERQVESDPAPASSAASLSPSSTPGPNPTPAPNPTPTLTPTPTPSPTPTPESDTPMLACKQFQCTIWDQPNYDSLKLGYIRAGSKIGRSPEPLIQASLRRRRLPADAGPDAQEPPPRWKKGDPPILTVQPCGGHWYAVEPAGFVCEGRDGATNDVNDPVVVNAAKAHLPKDQPLPYGYGLVWGTQSYMRVPTDKEQHEQEGDVMAWRKLQEEQRAKMAPEKRPPVTAIPVGPVPEFLANGAQAPAILPWLVGIKGIRGGYLMPQTRLAFVAAFDVPFEGIQRTFYLTSELLLVAADKVKAASPSSFEGVELDGPQAREKLPMIWMREPGAKQPANVWKVTGDTATKTEVILPEKAHAMIADKELFVQGVGKLHELLEPPAGLPRDPNVKYAIRFNDGTRLDALKALPGGVKEDEVWIDVDIYRQTLVMYRGLTPTFVTLVSSGSGGKKKFTPQGTFRIYQKHITTRMHGEEKPADGADDEAEHAYRFDDVPWVQYVYAGIALHAAFWHDGFGQPRSHGCVNLSPKDAKYVFERTIPNIPKGWHSINGARPATGLGTVVVIHG